MEVVAIPALADEFALPAVVEPNRVVTVAAEVAARVERMPLEEGDAAKAGQLLVQLNVDLIEPALRTAQAQHDRNQIEFERMQSLVSENATSRQDLDNATVQLAASKATLEEAQARLERTQIVAPVRGILNKQLVEEGEYVQPGTPVAEVVEIDPVKVVVSMPERNVAFFRVGGRAKVLVDAPNGEGPLEGTITYIDKLADPQTRTTALEITVGNEAGVLRSGQIVRAQLTRQIVDDAIMIPLAAVIPMEDGYAVYIEKDGLAKREMVTLGLIQADSVQVLEGLAPGQRLIVQGHRFVAPGQKVKVVPGLEQSL
jgi:membrane fusion protein (multidrug efflux system)